MIFFIGLIMRAPLCAMESKMSKATFYSPLISFISILERYRLFVLFVYLPVPFCFTLEILLHILRWENCTAANEHPTKGNRQWNVLEIARLPLARLQRTMQFSRIMQRRRSFAAGNFIVSIESMEATKRLALNPLNGSSSRSQSLAISWSE